MPSPSAFLRLAAALVLAAAPARFAARAQSAGPLTAFRFLQLEPSARSAALGGAFTAVHGDDANAVFYNPALLNPEMHGMLSLTYLNHLADVSAGFVSYAREVGSAGTFAFGLRYLSYGSMERADAAGARDGTFGASDAALTLGVSRPLAPSLRYGVNVHALFSGIAEYSSRALAADAGVVFHQEERRLTLSASVHHLGRVLSAYDRTREELPVDVRVGVAKRLRYLPLLVTVTGYELHRVGQAGGGLGQEVLQHLAAGGEFQFSPNFNLRVGYNHRRHEALKLKTRLDLAGVGLGFGLKISRFRFDYAFNSWSSFGGLHHLSLRTRV